MNGPNVVKINSYPESVFLVERIESIINLHGTNMSVSEVVGCLECIKFDVIQRAKDAQEFEDEL